MAVYGHHTTAVNVRRVSYGVYGSALALIRKIRVNAVDQCPANQKHPAVEKTNEINPLITVNDYCAP